MTKPILPPPTHPTLSPFQHGALYAQVFPNYMKWCRAILCEKVLG